jgi:hypothetical protein
MLIIVSDCIVDSYVPLIIKLMTFFVIQGVCGEKIDLVLAIVYNCISIVSVQKSIAGRNCTIQPVTFTLL